MRFRVDDKELGEVKKMNKVKLRKIEEEMYQRVIKMISYIYIYIYKNPL